MDERDEGLGLVEEREEGIEVGMDMGMEWSDIVTAAEPRQERARGQERESSETRQSGECWAAAHFFGGVAGTCVKAIRSAQMVA